MRTTPVRVAVVGSGISGLSAFWALQTKANAGRHEILYEVHLFEDNDYFGGHTRSVRWKDTDVFVDVAFSLFNRTTYPNFTRFLKALDVRVSSTRITFGLSRRRDEFEWSSKRFSTVFPRWGDFLSFERWAMLWGIFKFNMCAQEVLNPHYQAKDETVAEYLIRNNYPNSFRENYLFPLLSSIWIHDPEQPVSSMPVTIVVQYLRNHHLLNTFSGPVDWLVIDGGAKVYVDRVLGKAPVGHLHKAKRVLSIFRSEGGQVKLGFEDEKEQCFDHVILATSAPEALRMLDQQATSEEREILSKFRTTEPSEVVLHSDESFMPRNRTLWSAWNYHDLTDSGPCSQGPRVSLTVDMTMALRLKTDEMVFATLNPSPSASSSNTVGRYKFKHPIYDDLTRSAQACMESIQGNGGVWFAGAWMGYGFHEDGCTAGLKVARMVRRKEEGDIDFPDEMPLRDWKDIKAPPLRVLIAAIKVFIGVLENVVVLFLAFLGVH